MQSVNRALLLGVVVVLAAAVACGGGEDEAAAAAAAAEAEVIEVSPEARAAARSACGETRRGNHARARPSAGRPRSATRSRRPGGARVTIAVSTSPSIRVRNLSQNAIAGFQVDEFWYDGDGNTVTGDQARRRLPILVNEVCDIELRVPVVSAMDRSNYEFSHQNGDIKATLLEDIEFPAPARGRRGRRGRGSRGRGRGSRRGRGAGSTRTRSSSRASAPSRECRPAAEAETDEEGRGRLSPKASPEARAAAGLGVRLFPAPERVGVRVPRLRFVHAFVFVRLRSHVGGLALIGTGSRTGSQIAL